MQLKAGMPKSFPNIFTVKKVYPFYDYDYPMASTAEAVASRRSGGGGGARCCNVVVDPLSVLTLIGFLAAATYFLNILITMNIGGKRRKRRRSGGGGGGGVSSSGGGNRAAYSEFVSHLLDQGKHVNCFCHCVSINCCIRSTCTYNSTIIPIVLLLY